jgi:hypothetical protein
MLRLNDERCYTTNVAIRRTLLYEDHRVSSNGVERRLLRNNGGVGHRLFRVTVARMRRAVRVDRPDQSLTETILMDESSAYMRQRSKSSVLGACIAQLNCLRLMDLLHCANSGS